MKTMFLSVLICAAWVGLAFGQSRPISFCPIRRNARKSPTERSPWERTASA